MAGKTIDLTSYERQRDRLRQELTLTQIDSIWRSHLWVQASLNQKQRLQQLFFGDGVAFDGKQFVRTAVTANAFKYLTAVGSSQNEVASLPFASWNQMTILLRQIDGLRRAA